MSQVIFGVVLFCTILAQSTFLPTINPLPVMPNVALVLVFLWASHHTVRESLFWVFVAGIVIDVLTIDPLGSHALAMVPLVLLTHPLRIRPWQFPVIAAMLLMSIVTAMYVGILMLFRDMTLNPVSIGTQAIEDAILVPVIYFLLRLVGR